MEHWIDRKSPRYPYENDSRNDYEVDYARVIHSSSFRRLQGKTQIHQGDSDVPRTRMTHSLEVSQIALGIAQRIKNLDIVDEDSEKEIINLVSDPQLIQVIGLCHDLGHPCGGHAGEEALNSLIPYEGNGQTLRILTKLENHTQEFGANLTRRTLLGILKYPISYSEASRIANKSVTPPRIGYSSIPLIGPEHSPPKCYLDSESDIVDWMFLPYQDIEEFIRKNLIKSFDAGLMDIADDFAYSAADLEDAIALNMMKREWLENDLPDESWEALALYQKNQNDNIQSKEDIINRLMGSSYERKRQTGIIINYLLSGIGIEGRSWIKDPLYKYKVVLEKKRMDLVKSLKNCVFERVIKSTSVQIDRLRIQKMIIDVYDVLTQFPDKYLPEKYRDLYEKSGKDSRIIADYVSGMTDRYLATTHKQMFG